MTSQPTLAFAPTSNGTPLGAATFLTENHDGGQVFIHGLLTHAWEAGDEESRRFAAVNLLTLRAATAARIATAFGIAPATLWKWKSLATTGGIAALTSEKRGPKGSSKLTSELITRIHQLKAQGLSNRTAAEQAGVSEFSIRRALTLNPATGQPADTPPVIAPNTTAVAGNTGLSGPDVETAPVQDQLPLLADLAPRTVERAAVTSKEATAAVPVFTPAASVPMAGLLLALPALEATGLQECMQQTYSELKPGFYGLTTIILETVLRTLAGEPRAEGATRRDPVAFGQLLGLDRAPDSTTIRRKHRELADQKKAGQLLEALGRHHVEVLAPTAGANNLGLLLYVDGHVRSYQGSKKVGKQFSTRLKFPVPATMETWVADSNGAPVFMVMAAPNSSLVGELRRLVPTLRTMIGDQRRVLIGFDREGWSPQLFHELMAAGFDPLTWRKPTPPRWSWVCLPSRCSLMNGVPHTLMTRSQTPPWTYLTEPEQDRLCSACGR